MAKPLKDRQPGLVAGNGLTVVYEALGPEFGRRFYDERITAGQSCPLRVGPWMPSALMPSSTAEALPRLLCGLERLLAFDLLELKGKDLRQFAPARYLEWTTFF
jgi:hypothetical protein